MNEFGTYGVWAIQGATVLFVGFIFMWWAMRKKAAYANFVKDKVKCRFKLPNGDSIVKWMVVTGNIITVPKRGKQPSRAFGIAESGVYGIEYPEGWCPKFMRVQAKEALFDYNSAEPLSNNTGRPIVNAVLFLNRLQEKDTADAMQSAEKIDQEGAVMSSSGKALGVYICLAVIIIVVGIVGYFTIRYIPAIKDGIEALRAAKGI